LKEIWVALTVIIPTPFPEVMFIGLPYTQQQSFRVPGFEVSIVPLADMALAK
jgi:hypothetical protein